MKMCVNAAVGKTHLQCVLLSSQRRETAARTRGCTDKSPKVLGGFAGVLTIAAWGGLLLDCLHIQVNTFSGSFLSFSPGSALLSLFEPEAHYLPCCHYKLDSTTGKKSTASFGFLPLKFCFSDISLVNSDSCLTSSENLIRCLHSSRAEFCGTFQ